MQLRPLEAPFGEGVRDALAAFDCAEHHVNGFLHSGLPELGSRQRLATTYVLVDPDPAEGPPLLGFVTLALSQIRLTNSEKRAYEGPRLGAIGAVRVAMLGVDARVQGRGHGKRLLEAAAGLARRVDQLVAARFLVADANPERLPWYLAQGWIENESASERERLQASGAVSIRFDLAEVPT